MSWFESVGGETTCHNCGFQAARHGHRCPRCGVGIGMTDGQYVGLGVSFGWKFMLFSIGLACGYGAWTGEGIETHWRIIFGLIALACLKGLGR